MRHNTCTTWAGKNNYCRRENETRLLPISYLSHQSWSSPPSLPLLRQMLLRCCASTVCNWSRIIDCEIAPWVCPPFSPKKKNEKFLRFKFVKNSFYSEYAWGTVAVGNRHTQCACKPYVRHTPMWQCDVKNILCRIVCTKHDVISLDPDAACRCYGIRQNWLSCEKTF